MATRSKTTVFDEQNKPLLSIVGQWDGKFDFLGAKLQEFLSDTEVVGNWLRSGLPKKRWGMSGVAASLIKFINDNSINNFIIVPASAPDEEFNYEIRYLKVDGSSTHRVTLVGYNYGDRKRFILYREPVKVLRSVQFVYDKRDGSEPTWRRLDVTEETDKYLLGLEGGEFKKFLYSRIVGRRVLPA